MKTLDIQTGTVRLLFVLPPIVAKNFEVVTNQSVIPYSKSLKYEANAFRGYINYDDIDLPEGNWSDPIKVDEVTEVQCVDLAQADHIEGYYLNYIPDGDFPVKFYEINTALESFQSLLKANEIYLENPHANFECPNQWCENGYIDQGWGDKWRCQFCQDNEDKEEEAEEMTGNWLMLVEKKK